MIRWFDYVRFARFVLAVSLVPFVRSCDGRGIWETTGFPLPFAAHADNIYSFNRFDITALGINVAIFILAATIATRFAPDALRKISEFWVFIVVCLYSVFCLSFNFFIFSLFSLAALWFKMDFNETIVDVSSRALFVVVFFGAFLTIDSLKTDINNHK